MIPLKWLMAAFAGACLVLAGALHFWGIEKVAAVAPVFTAFVAILAVSIAYAAMWWNRRIARLKATLDLIEGSESKEYYQDRYKAYRTYRRADATLRDQIADPTVKDHDEVRAKCQDFLNHYELVAISCRQGLIDETFYRSWMGPTFIRDWNEAAILVRRARRPDGPGDSGNPEAYIEFERLARKWGGQSLPAA